MSRIVNYVMQFRFLSDNLRKLYLDASYTDGRSPAVVKGFRKVMGIVKNATDERDFMRLRGLNYERLKGARTHQHSMRLNVQFRLILELEGEGAGKVVVVVDIEDYH